MKMDIAPTPPEMVPVLAKPPRLPLSQENHVLTIIENQDFFLKKPREMGSSNSEDNNSTSLEEANDVVDDAGQKNS